MEMTVDRAVYIGHCYVLGTGQNAFLYNLSYCSNIVVKNDSPFYKY